MPKTGVTASHQHPFALQRNLKKIAFCIVDPKLLSISDYVHDRFQVFFWEGGDESQKIGLHVKTFKNISRDHFRVSAHIKS
jgi:hypothetical protein